MAVTQNTKEARPPERKFDRPGDIYPESEECHGYQILEHTSYGVPCSRPNARMSTCGSQYIIRARNLDDDWDSLLRLPLWDSSMRWTTDGSPRIRTNMKKKLLRKAKLPPKPLQSPWTPLVPTTWRMQSIGPLNFRSFVARSRCNCKLTVQVVNFFFFDTILSLIHVPFKSSIGWASIALLWGSIRITDNECFFTLSNLQRDQRPSGPTLTDACFQSLVQFPLKTVGPIRKGDSCEAIQGGRSQSQPILDMLLKTGAT